MPRRSVVPRACQSCRKSRTKCDGLQSCARCKIKDVHCSYDRPEATSKAALRAEVQKLQGQLEEWEALFNAFKLGTSTSPRNTPNAIIEALGRGDSRISITKMLNSIQEVDTHTCAASKDTIEAASYLDSAVAESDVDSPNPLTRQRLVCGQDGDDSPTVVSESGSTNNSPFDYPLAAASASNATPRAATGQSSNTISIPTHFLAQRDPWTNSGWTKLHVRELVTSVLSWDGIPLCVVNKGHFLADFDTGAAQYCSSTLVNGLLAIATRLEENNHHHHHQDTTHRGRGVPSSYDFIREARACSLDKDYVSALANIQALGVLALYQTSFGQIVETQKLVDDYAAATASLYLSKSTAAPGNDYDRVCEETYHGAISLQRLLHLTGVIAKPLFIEDAQEIMFLNKWPCGNNFVRLVDDIGYHVPGEAPAQTWHNPSPHHMLTGNFQLTGSD